MNLEDATRRKSGQLELPLEGRGEAPRAERSGEALTAAAELRGYLVGWKEYFRLADTPRILRDLDEWIRHRLRAIQLKQWKRGTTIFRELRARGLSENKAIQVAANSRRWWRNSGMAIHIALPASHFDNQGLPRLAALNLNSPNRRMRTRTSGGVGGA